ncbi:hypothetical protein [Janthinobacterium sp. AD80]|uniref:hypothetical protein n=1 Tax=Janthinobacterium sp. AD80 TaxID=1528773 RepID=UPI0015E07AC7|nr:hypothetical protein [Janthinobacterium sp. AD80]
MAILLSLRASIARTFATRSCSWFIPERGSMPITIDLELSGRPGVPAGWLFAFHTALVPSWWRTRIILQYS